MSAANASAGGSSGGGATPPPTPPPTTTTTTPSPTYSPPPLRLLAAQAAAKDLARLLPSHTDAFRALGEEDLALLFALVVREGKLTPRLALAFQQVAAEHNHAALEEALRGLDILAGITSTDTTACASPLSPRRGY